MRKFDQIIAMREAGSSYAEIAAALDTSESYIKDCLKSATTNLSGEDR